mmetsp:Transcript_11811/g.21524  ORF Transcript_11811/g.21524 Transcript_11811/m.21524 type:complete len:514 (+) Transcript_11811:60-1601(+)
MPLRGLQCFERLFGRRRAQHRLALSQPLHAGQAILIANEAILNIQEESATLASLPLPPDTKDLVAEIQRCLRDLDHRVQCTRRNISNPWGRVPEDDEAEWKLLKLPGSFLHTQLCLVSEDDEDEGAPATPIVARLFVSTAGLYFLNTAATSNGQSSAKSSSLTRTREYFWNDIARVQRSDPVPFRPGCTHDVEIDFQKRPPMKLSLGSAWQAYCLEEAWTQAARIGSMEIDDDGEDGGAMMRFFSFIDEEDTSTASGVSANFLPSGSSASDTDMEILSRRHPDERPLFQCRFSTTTLAAVQKAFLKNEDWLLYRFVKERLGAQELEGSGWIAAGDLGMHTGRQPPLVRTMAFQMPLPKDVPAAVRRLVNVPDFASVSSTYCMQQHTKDTLTIVQWSNSAGVPFAGNLKVEDILQFTQCTDGGVLLEKWTNSIWRSGTPYLIRRFVDFKVHREAVAIMDAFLQSIEDAARQVAQAAANGDETVELGLASDAGGSQASPSSSALTEGQSPRRMTY